MFLFQVNLWNFGILSQQVCKKRSKAAGSLKSPNTATLRSTKHFKHVRLIPLNDIKRVFDVKDSEGNNEGTVCALISINIIFNLVPS